MVAHFASASFSTLVKRSSISARNPKSKPKRGRRRVVLSEDRTPAAAALAMRRTKRSIAKNRDRLAARRFVAAALKAGPGVPMGKRKTVTIEPDKLNDREAKKLAKRRPLPEGWT